MILKDVQIIVCDLDGTLAESKSALGESMALTISCYLKNKYFAVISGGDWFQFQKQFLSHILFALQGDNEVLSRLLLFPTSGAKCYRYIDGVWQNIYEILLTRDEKKNILDALHHAISLSGIMLPVSYGPIFEDRSTQITFSGCGQDAPIEIKSIFDPDQKKRRKIIEFLQKTIPEFEIAIGGMTTIDITQRGINKAYAIEKIKEMLHLGTREIIFLGDALYPGGNDEKAKESGVECIQVSGPDESQKIINSIMKSYAHL